MSKYVTIIAMTVIAGCGLWLMSCQPNKDSLEFRIVLIVDCLALAVFLCSIIP